MVKKFLFFLLIFLFLFGFFYFQKNKNQNSTTLVIYTYSSFAASWGVGPQIIKDFQKQNNVTVQLVDVGDANTILQRLELEKQNPKADVVIGIDQLALADATLQFKWKNYSTNIEMDPQISKQASHPQFVAYNWAPLTFVYRKGEIEPPLTKKDLLKAKYKKEIVLFDPQMSTPGFIFFNWLAQSVGFTEISNYFEKLKTNILTVTPSWSMGYGLFKKKQAKLVFSYVTSPVYHWINDHDNNFQAVSFEEPVPYQIEYAGILDSTKNEELAKQFIFFLVTSEIQKKIMLGNYMFPVLNGIKKNTLFEKLPTLQLYENQPTDKQKILDLWKTLR